MIKNINTDNNLEQAFLATKDAMDAVGKLKKEDIANYELKCKMRYGLQSMAVSAKIINDQNSCSIQLEAISDDAFQVGAKKVLAKLIPEIEKNLSKIEIIDGANENSELNGDFQNKSLTNNSDIEQKIFAPKTYRFDTEVTIKLDNQKVSATDGSSNSSIDAQDIDNLTFIENWEGKVTVGGFWFRIIGISALIAIASEMFFGGWSLGSFGVTFILIIINVIVSAVVVIDALFELNFIRGIIRSYFSYDFYQVAIGNNSGNNIEFIANIDEVGKLKDLDKKISELKSNNKKKASNKQPIQQPVNQGTNLDELKKLGELFKNGILTQEEFDNKKAELLK